MTREPHKQWITQIHIDDKCTSDFQTINNSKKISTLWDTDASKSITSRCSLEKSHDTGKIQPHSGIHISSAISNTVWPIGKVTLNISLRRVQLNHKFIVCKNCTPPITLGLDIHHKFQIGTDWDRDGKLFFHRNGCWIIYANKTSKFIPKNQSTKYQEIPLYNSSYENKI